MPINDIVWALAGGGFPRRFGQDDWMSCGGAKAGLEAKALAMLDHPFAAVLQILLMLRLGRDAGEAHVLAQFFNKPALIILQVFQDRLHGVYLWLTYGQ
jgi:hypothetical protein